MSRGAASQLAGRSGRPHLAAVLSGCCAAAAAPTRLRGEAVHVDKWRGARHDIQLGRGCSALPARPVCGGRTQHGVGGRWAVGGLLGALNCPGGGSTSSSGGGGGPSSPGGQRTRVAGDAVWVAAELRALLGGSARSSHALQHTGGAGRRGGRVWARRGWQPWVHSRAGGQPFQAP